MTNPQDLDPDYPHQGHEHRDVPLSELSPDEVHQLQEESRDEHFRQETDDWWREVDAQQGEAAAPPAVTEPGLLQELGQTVESAADTAWQSVTHTADAAEVYLQDHAQALFDDTQAGLGEQ